MVLLLSIQTDRMKTAWQGSWRTQPPELHDGVCREPHRRFCNKLGRIIILVAPADQPGKIAQATSDQALTTAIIFVNPTIFNTR